MRKILQFLIPVAAVVIAYLLLTSKNLAHAPLHGRELAGGVVLVVAAILALLVSRRGKKPPAQPAPRNTFRYGGPR